MRYILLIALLLASCTKEVKPSINSIHPYLEPYYNEFIELTGHVNKSEVVILEFSKLMPYRVLGIAIGMDVDSAIIIKINADYWNKLNANEKWFLLMHELAHDILNAEHGDFELMETPMPFHISDDMIERAKEDLKAK